MELGAFSISPAVKDIEASRVFYEKFGFKIFAENAAQHWLILKNGPHDRSVLRHVRKNTLTFKPGWDSNAQKLAAFTDLHRLQRELKAKGVQLTTEADETTTWPASFLAIDPDGNPILVDQHV
jgi:lactoylglutathione lyase